MHQRPMPVGYEFTKLYEIIRAREVIEYLNNMGNVSALEELERKYPGRDFRKFVEPTKAILETALHSITQLYGSEKGYDFYNFINTKTLELANGIKNELYSDTLPNEYFMESDILCEPIIRICMSGAKGSINSIDALASKLFENDGTTEITTHIAPLDRAGLFGKLDVTSKAMAESSKRVQSNGHAFFKSNIGYDFLSFEGDKVCFHGKPIYDNLNFLPPYMLISPTISNLILNLH